jgi:hypothetical protein
MQSGFFPATRPSMLQQLQSGGASASASASVLCLAGEESTHRGSRLLMRSTRALDAPRAADASRALLCAACGCYHGTCTGIASLVANDVRSNLVRCWHCNGWRCQRSRRRFVRRGTGVRCDVPPLRRQFAHDRRFAVVAALVASARVRYRTSTWHAASCAVQATGNARYTSS